MTNQETAKVVARFPLSDETPHSDVTSSFRAVHLLLGGGGNRHTRTGAAVRFDRSNHRRAWRRQVTKVDK